MEDETILREGVSENELLGVLGPTRYAEYTMARVLVQAHMARRTVPGSSREEITWGTGFFVLFIVGMSLAFWLLEGHPGSFFSWFWQDMLKSIR